MFNMINIMIKTLITGTRKGICALQMDIINKTREMIESGVKVEE